MPESPFNKVAGEALLSRIGPEIISKVCNKIFVAETWQNLKAQFRLDFLVLTKIC